jgi:protein SCO1/2
MRGKPKGGDFTLQSADGPVSLHDMRGKVVMLIFGYTMCHAACPITLTLIANVLTQLKAEEIKLVRVLFVSIDPERDTLDKLKKFTSFFHPNIIGITDRPGVVLKVADQYGSVYFKEKVTDSAMGYAFLHDTAIHLVAPDGRLSETLSHETSADTIVKTIQRILGKEKH